MFIHFDADRPSDSPFIERVWSCHSESGGSFLAVAAALAGDDSALHVRSAQRRFLHAAG